MKQLIAAVLCTLLALTSVHAQDKSATTQDAPPVKKDAKKAPKAKKPPTEAQKKQQERMRKCNADAKAKGVKGKEERNKFMSGCLKG